MFYLNTFGLSANFGTFHFEQVLSGDTIVIRGQPHGGPPPTRTVALSNILAPRLARRANPNIEGSLDTVDEVLVCKFCFLFACTC